MTTATDWPAADQLPEHHALIYQDDESYASSIGTFIADGLAAGEPVLVAVPGPNAELLRTHLEGRSDQVGFVDPAEVGRNPANIIPAVLGFANAHSGRQTRFVGEPLWPTRSASETREATLHEALVNRAFAGVPMSILCPYDARWLPPAVIADAKRNHPLLFGQQHDLPHSAYGALAVASAIYSRSPAKAPRYAESLEIEIAGLSRLRRFVETRAIRAGLGQRRSEDFVLAVNEVATNSIVHGEGTGTVRLWLDSDELICEITDGGHNVDPLVGRLQPPLGATTGRGLRMVNQLCDLVEMRSGEWGSNVRLRMARTADRELPLDQARAAASLTYRELWLRYFELGGTKDESHIEALCRGFVELVPHDRETLAQALDERFEEDGDLQRFPYP